jgi:hypothetical protein
MFKNHVKGGITYSGCFRGVSSSWLGVMVLLSTSYYGGQETEIKECRRGQGKI